MKGCELFATFHTNALNKDPTGSVNAQNKAWE